MARKRRSKKRPVHSGPLSPYPHLPHKPGIYVLYIDWKEEDKSCVPIYAEAFGAKRHLDILLKGLSTTIADDDALVGIVDDKRWLIAENGIRVKCSRLQDILDHEDSPEEAEWKMENRHIREIESFRYGMPQTEKDSQPVETPQESNRRARRAKRRDENSQPRKKREIPTGSITVAMIAESLSILPREARARLRKAKVSKPDNGWVWPEADADEIKSLIAKG